MSNVPESIVVSEDGYSLPVIEVLTGRGFITGKSGSGKSNTASVIAEELLASGVSILIVDTDGEYYGLKEQFDLLHAGADDNCDVEVGAEDAEEIAETAIVEDVPVILDVSGYMDGATVDEIIKSVVEALFRLEKEQRKPFLLFVEEVHEFIPETGGLDDLGEMLIRVAKRGRKRGLGMVGMSQRPAAVDKDFITQCDWLVWHRLTWDNDTKVAGQIMGSDYTDAVQDLDTGEAFVMTDWDEVITRIQFRRKRTLDAGATPGLAALEDSEEAHAEMPDEPPADAEPQETAAEDPADDPAAESEAAGPADQTPTDAPADGAAAEGASKEADTAAASGAAATADEPAASAQEPAASDEPGAQAPAKAEAPSAPDRSQGAGGDQSVVIDGSNLRQRAAANRQRSAGMGNQGSGGESRKRKPADSHPSDDAPVHVLWEFGHMMTHAAWAAMVRAKRVTFTVASAVAAGCRAVASSAAAGWRALAGTSARAVGREWADDDESGGSAASSDQRRVTLLILVALAVLAVVLVVAAL